MVRVTMIWWAARTQSHPTHSPPLMSAIAGALGTHLHAKLAAVVDFNRPCHRPSMFASCLPQASSDALHPGSSPCV
jgi:hypothetical protein